MSNTFEINRFGKYLGRELHQGANNFGISLLIAGFLPVIFYLFCELFFKIISGDWGIQADGNRASAISVAYITCLLSFSVKQYGNITDKRFGSEYLMLPASPFEKWLSMVLISCVILPAVLFTMLLGSDALMSLVFPTTYGESLLGEGNVLWVSYCSDDVCIAGSPLGILWLQWAMNMLAFNLGVLVFKKAKVGKTLLVIIGFSVLCGLVSIGIIGDSDELESIFNVGTVQETVNRFYWFIGAIYFVLTAGLGAGLYARIKTLKL